MTKMLTLFGEDISELKYNKLKRERQCHSFLLTRVKLFLKAERKELEKHPDSQVRKDKIEFFETYRKNLEALIEEIDYWMDRRYEPEKNASSCRSAAQIRRENHRRHRNIEYDSKQRVIWGQDGNEEFIISWDKDKFDLIAKDRGYQTEEAVISDVQKLLKFNRTKTKLVLSNGRLTWGQVLVLGAYFEMTPKEFCDTFLAGYFTENYGEYRADYDRINREALLKRTMKSNPLYGYEQVEVGSDGRPLDEEEWFDE